MADSAVLLSAALVCMAGVVSPGPNFLAVSHRAVSSARQHALAMAFGIALVNALWAGLSLFGLNVLLARVPTLAWVIPSIGSAYLLWYGIQLIRHSGREPVGDTDSAEGSGFRSALRDGIATNLANPKSMAFYASVFSGAVPGDAGVETLLLLVGLVCLIGSFWYGCVALVFSGARVAKLYRCCKTLIERSCGLLLIGFAIRQAPIAWPL